MDGNVSLAKTSGAHISEGTGDLGIVKAVVRAEKVRMRSLSILGVLMLKNGVVCRFGWVVRRRFGALDAENI